MAFFSTTQVAIKGISAAVPQTGVSNSALPGFSKTELDALIATLGIEKRRVAGPGLCASDLCQAAAEKLIAGLNWNKSEIEALFFVSQTPDHVLPGTSMHLQQRLGLPSSCATFDINQGCAGYVYGLSLISAFMSAGGLRKGLLLVGDTITKIVSPEDKSIVPIFSDAGTATALEYDTTAEKMTFNTTSYGADYGAIIIPQGGAREPLTPEALTYRDYENGNRRQGIHLAMKGMDVFTFSLRKVAPHVEELLQRAGVQSGELDQFVFHQANRLILDSIGAKLNINPAKLPSTLKEYGNTSSATVPLTIVSELGKNGAIPNARMLLCGFGVGLSLASAIVNFKEVYCPEIIEM